MSDEKKYQKKVIFIGMPDTAYLTLHALHDIGTNIVAVITPPENHPTCMAFSQYAKNWGYNVISPKKSINESEIIKEVSKYNADVALVTSYSQKFSKELLNTTKDGFVNVHPSLLPEYRGANPYSHVLINNEKHTGVTIHKMTEEFDSGNILMQNQIQIAPNDTMGTLFNKLNRLSCEMLVKFIQDYEEYGMQEGVSQAELPQPKRVASKILPESDFTKINWNKSATEIEALIRGLNPFLPAGTTFKGINLKIFSAEVVAKKTSYAVGQVCNLGETIDVATGNGILKIRTLQLGSFFIGSARDFRERVKISLGDTFV